MSEILRDAQNRAVRTAYQGFTIDILVAIGAALAAWVSTNDITTAAAWLTLAVSLAKSILQTAAAFLMRLKLDTSRIPTPLPPGDPGEPSEDPLTEE